ncbi:MAG: hypothetical protein QOD37_329 [Gaiellales bacterium]|nr:hypothetical protein [Gaiellales bacterium]
MIGGVFLIAVLVLVVARAGPGAARMLRATRMGERRDRAARLLLLAVSGLPADRADWGQAMLGELDEATGSRARWRFSVGCVKAVMTLRARQSFGGSHRDGALVRTVVLGAVAAALALGGYGLVRYPLLRAGEGARASALMLLAVLLAYVVCALCLSRGMTPTAVVARRYGLCSGVAIGAGWLVVIFPSAPLKEWVFVPLAMVMLGPACVAALAARATGDPRTATAASMWCGLVGALVVFLIWVTATYLDNGGPIDPQLIRDFHASGAPDLTTYAIGDNLGGALGMLVMIPTIALAAGSFAARLAAR